MRSPRKYKKRNSPRTEPWRGQTDEVKLVTSKSKHTALDRVLARTLQVLHILFVAGCENNLSGNVRADLGVIYIIGN